MRTIIFLVVTLFVLAAGSDDEKTHDVDRYLNKWGKLSDENNNKHEREDLQGEKDEMEYVNEFQEALARRRREAFADPPLIRHERSISRKGSLMQINLVSFHEPGAEEAVRRQKRATFNTTSTTWPDRIPYVFNTSYPEELRPKVRRIMDELQEHICVTWVEEPDFDQKDNDYETNAYLHFVGSTSNICGAFVGQGSGTRPRRIKTCTSYYTIAHELLHTLGTIHEQQGPLSVNHVSLATQNVIPNHIGGTYSRSSNRAVIETSEFDSSSLMMYSRRAFTKNGLDIVLPFRLDELVLNNDRRTNLANNFYELSIVYMCREKHCGDDNVDCGLGYYTYYKGSCRCVCPAGFDPATNCQQLDNENSGPDTWPDVGFSMYGNEKNKCPEGFTPGTFDITGSRNARYFYEPFPKSGKTVNYYFCTRTSTGTDMERMPMGTYCFIKPVGSECNGAFTEGGYLVTSTLNVTYSGDFGDWEVPDHDPAKVKMKFCCRTDKEEMYTLEMPRKEGFTLISRSGKCGTIEGLRYSYGLVVMFVKKSKKYGVPPRSWLASYYLIHGFCKYTPGKYGCNEQVTLDAAHPTQTFKTPGFDAGQREANRRCLYNFKVPPGARVKITMDVFDVHKEDLFNIRRFHKWAMPQLDFAARFKKEFISQKDFLYLEWWAGDKGRTGTKGIQFTAQVLLKENSCYNIQDRGRNYIGSKKVTENFEECLPWEKAAECDDFPFYGAQSLEMLSHNYCRNPHGAMERPWCYVSVNRGMCRRAYCDVCNDLQELDQLHNCADLLKANPTLCANTLQKMKCAKTCGFEVNVPPPSAASGVSCGTPPTPFDGTATTTLKTGYNLGEIVSFSCNIRSGGVDLECTPSGWPTLTSACSECEDGWIPYGDRCFHFSGKYRLIDEANEYCHTMGGRMFEIRDATDLRTIRKFKQTSTLSGATGGSWINAKLVPGGNWTLWDNEHINAPAMEWAPNAVIDDFVDHGCAVMIWEKDNSGNAGKYDTTSCNLAASRTFCEMSRSVPASHNCSDISPSCMSALYHDPDLCNRTNSYMVASQYCQKSCGECAQEDHAQCSEPESTTYIRTSADSIINMGDIMEFACKSGLYLVHGRLRRVCGHGGNLIGPDPVCSPNPTKPVEVGVDEVLMQNDVMPTNAIMLMDVNGYRVPFAGNLTQWHFYGVKTGYIHFVVYRHNPTSDTYTMLGYNTVAMTVAHERWTYQVPVAQQIRVEEGDVFGMFTIDGEIAGTACDKRDVAFMVLRKENAKSIDAGMIGTESPFAGQSCYAPSLGATIAPCK